MNHNTQYLSPIILAHKINNRLDHFLVTLVAFRYYDLGAHTIQTFDKWTDAPQQHIYCDATRWYVLLLSK